MSILTIANHFGHKMENCWYIRVLVKTCMIYEEDEILKMFARGSKLSAGLH